MTRTICHLFEARLGEAQDADTIPLSLLALDGGTPAGTVTSS